MKVLSKLAEGQTLMRGETAALASSILRRELTPAQCGAALTAMRVRGESVDEIGGFIDAFREFSLPTPFGGDDLIDTCGTGGDGHNTINISTLSAFVAAAAGCRVVKHCNRAVTGRCGSADLLGELEIRFDGSVEFVARSLESTGLAFLFAPRFHPLLREMAELRRELGFRTIFNIAAPLANPARPRRQVIGVFHPSLLQVAVETVAKLGALHCMAVHGEDGMDELTTGGTSHVFELRDGRITEFHISPETFGLTRTDAAELRADSVQVSAALAMDVLRGKRFAGRDAVALNAGAAVYVGGCAASLEHGVARALEVIDSGAALEKLVQLQQLSRDA
jgi:anthranilate phosphoribosyltransferase